MNKSRWIPWIITIVIGIGAPTASYLLMRVDKTTEAQAGYAVSQAYLYKEYVTRLEYDKDYRSLGIRIDGLESTIKENNRDTNKKLDILLGYVKQGMN